MRIFYAAISIAVGLLVLGGYFHPALKDIQSLLLNWAIIITGAAMIVGVFNLIFVHTNKIRRREKGSLYSALLVIALAASLIFGLLFRPSHPAIQTYVLNGIIIPVESALMGILTITLLYAAIRLLRKRRDLTSVVFLAAAVVILLGSATLPFGDVPLFGTLIRPWMTQVLALGGARGILIGIALGSLTTGLRVLFGADRPYGGS